MVNRGVSRACETCRKRRKKCDETRPRCLRCTKAGRACQGYRRYDELYFRYYVDPASSPTPPAAEKTPLEVFLDDYVVPSIDPTVSRGFLDGLPSFLHGADASSDLVMAAELVAYTSMGHRLGRPDLLDQAAQKYVGLLHSFRITLSSQIHGPTIETLVTAILLGLYEIVSGGIGSRPGQHVAHVHGVCAILSLENSPFDLFTSTQLFQVANPLILKQPLKPSLTLTPGVLCAPISYNSVQNLDTVLIRCHPLFERANSQLADPNSSSETLQATFADALTLEEAFSQWTPSQSEAWHPQLICSLRATKSNCPYYRPGPVHAYFDVYVAAVMNTYRKTYLMLLEVLIKIAPRLSQTDRTTKWMKQSHLLIDDIVASIPYHLARNLHEYTETGQSAVGRPVGGLLLLHPLFVVSTCTIVPPPIQAYVRRCLAWIGKHMGIGQATLLSEARSDQPLPIIPFQQMAEGHVLIWACMLLQPSPSQT
ncbi:hypothetical protein BO71DRAFT_387273 [Aspergillus ellipticus CBS 707.79]|uniref:Zn(2)-C6 fungal-type domain-containing protein n=1 Tax=Aspergillus ellipticus CBS 707.79 TaxID=1448320 RepID=A0A319EI29_9EURO|nr:hypothetical protein BO71DRAFT_387273 [Aspergillus ellipticus CBS 707.79]